MQIRIGIVTVIVSVRSQCFGKQGTRLNKSLLCLSFSPRSRSKAGEVEALGDTFIDAQNV